MDSIALSEDLMLRGWWDEAAKAINRPDVAPADRFLQGNVLACRKECVGWIIENREIPAGRLSLELLRRFDAYTVAWVMNEYIGEGSAIWRIGNERENDLTD